MRAQIERRFTERVREELHLTDDQAARLRTTTQEYAKRRQDLRQRERTLRQALADQLRPGIAADDDSVARLTDELVGLRLHYVENLRDEFKDLSGFLAPVQRARFLVMRERLFRAMREARGRRSDGWAGRRMDGGPERQRP